MTERSHDFLTRLEMEAGLAAGLLTQRFLSVFAINDDRLDAISQDDLDRIREHFLAAAAGRRAQRVVTRGTQLSPAEIQMYRHMFQDAGGRIVGDSDIAPQTTETLRFLCPFCTDAGETGPEEVDVEARPALPGTAGALHAEDKDGDGKD